MVHPINELDIAALKVEFRNMYKKIGYLGALQCLYEIILSGNLLLDVIIEERKNENIPRS